MKILAENNAFQNFGKCLKGKASDADALKDFLQICVQMIFYDTIMLSNFVNESIRGIAEEIIDEIYKHGSDKTAITLGAKNLPRNQHEYVLHAIATEFAAKLPSILNGYTNMTDNASLMLPQNIGGRLNDFIKLATNAIKAGEDALIKNTLREQSKTGLDSYFFEVLNRIEKVDELLQFSKEHGWTEWHSFNIAAKFRMCSNLVIAGYNNAYYSPSVKRWQINNFVGHNNPMFIPDKVDNILEMYLTDYPEDFRYLTIDKIELPSMTDFLLYKGHADPEEVLKHAFALREHFRPLRELIKSKGSLEVNAELEELKNELYAKLRQNVTPSKPKMIVFSVEPGFGWQPPNDIGTVRLPIPVPNTQYKNESLKQKSLFALTELLQYKIDDNYWGWKLLRKH